MSVEAMQASIDHETQCKKCCIAFGSMVHLAFAGAIGIIFALWWSNANQWNAIKNEYCERDSCDAMIYNMGPLIYWYSDKFKATNYYGDNIKTADSYVNDLIDQCGLDHQSSCWYEGNRWSIVYALCCSTMLLLAVNSGLMVIGAWSLHARGLAACCGSVCCCLNVAAIVTTGVFRYNTWGLLSALCDGPNKYEGEENGQLTISDDRTYSGDATLITALWICQMVFCCTSCCHMGYSGKPT